MTKLTELPPIVRDVVALLPADGRHFSAEVRDKWLRMMGSVLEWVYPEQPAPTLPAFDEDYVTAGAGRRSTSAPDREAFIRLPPDQWRSIGGIFDHRPLQPIRLIGEEPAPSWHDTAMDKISELVAEASRPPVHTGLAAIVDAPDRNFQMWSGEDPATGILIDDRPVENMPADMPVEDEAPGQPVDEQDGCDIPADNIPAEVTPDPNIDGGIPTPDEASDRRCVCGYEAATPQGLGGHRRACTVVHAGQTYWCSTCDAGGFATPALASRHERDCLALEAIPAPAAPPVPPVYDPESDDPPPRGLFQELPAHGDYVGFIDAELAGAPPTVRARRRSIIKAFDELPYAAQLRVRQAMWEQGVMLQTQADVTTVQELVNDELEALTGADGFDPVRGEDTNDPDLADQARENKRLDRLGA